MVEKGVPQEFKFGELSFQVDKGPSLPGLQKDNYAVSVIFPDGLVLTQAYVDVQREQVAKLRSLEKTLIWMSLVSLERAVAEPKDFLQEARDADAKMPWFEGIFWKNAQRILDVLFDRPEFVPLIEDAIQVFDEAEEEGVEPVTKEEVERLHKGLMERIEEAERAEKEGLERPPFPEGKEWRPKRPKKGSE